MPKRILDSSLLSSPSLAKCSPRAQDAWPRFLLLMDDFGCADATPRVLLGAGWPLRDDVTEGDVRAWLEEYVAAGMACLWTANERRWVHLTGWFGPHGQRHRDEYDPATVKGRKGSKRKTPAPPPELIAAVIAGARRDSDGKPPGTDREDDSEIPRDSVPARETQDSREIPAPGPVETREFPAHAVAVPVAQEDHTQAQAPRRARLVSPFGDADPFPTTTAVLAVLFERGVDAAPPGANSAARVEAACVAAGVIPAADRLEPILRDPAAKRPLTFHIAAIRGTPKPRQTHGDLGAELRPWPSKLTREEQARARAELVAIAGPDFECAPLQATGDPSVHPVEAIQAFQAKWRAIAEARS